MLWIIKSYRITYMEKNNRRSFGGGGEYKRNSRLSSGIPKVEKYDLLPCWYRTKTKKIILAGSIVGL